MQQKVCQRRGEFFIMNRQELLGFFLQEKKKIIQFYVEIVKKKIVTIVTGLNT